MSGFPKFIFNTSTPAKPAKPAKPDPNFSNFSNFSDPAPVQKNKLLLRHAYRYRLHSGEGGTYITDSADQSVAFTELAKVYGERLAIVVKHG